MKGFLVSKPGDTHGELREDIPMVVPLKNEAKIKVLRAGVCNTDLEILQGYMGFTGVLGHEFVGIVEEINTDDESIKEKWLNKRVCGDINVGCSSCNVCLNFPYDRNKKGNCPMMSRNHCPTRSVLGILNRNGTIAEYLTLPVSNLHEVPSHVSDEVAVFAEPLAAACRIVEQNLVRYLDNNNSNNNNNVTNDDDDNGDDGSAIPPDKVAILGDGKLGLMIAEVLGREHSMRLGSSNKYPKPILFGKHKHKLDLVRESAGVDCRSVLDCKDEKSFNGVSAEYAGQFDVVVDATGSPQGLTLASGLCRPMGTLVLKSTCAAGETFNAAPFVIDELKVVGSRCGPIDKALSLLAITNDEKIDGSSDDNSNNNKETMIRPLNVEKYVTRTFPLSEAVDAIKCAAEKSTMKVQIICNES
jgi:threonine dehydrogenase-like Zn-dependent dehydrogenase